MPAQTWYKLLPPLYRRSSSAAKTLNPKENFTRYTRQEDFESPLSATESSESTLKLLIAVNVVPNNVLQDAGSLESAFTGIALTLTQCDRHACWSNKIADSSLNLARYSGFNLGLKLSCQFKLNCGLQLDPEGLKQLQIRYRLQVSVSCSNVDFGFLFTLWFWTLNIHNQLLAE